MSLIDQDYSEDQDFQQKKDVNTGQIQRRLEDEVNYWRNKAGWYDDDVSMKEYNSGVYSSFYSMDDDGSSSGSSGGGGGFISGIDDMLTTGAQILGALFGLAIIIMLIRAVSRRGSSKKKKSREDRSSRSKKSSRSSSRHRSSSRSRSKSRSSRSRSRARRSGGDDDYELMEDGRSTRSEKSSRSRSRSKARSKSRSRREEMLV